MKDIVFNINNKTRAVTLNTNVLGCVGEHLQGNIYIDFKGEFIDGTCFLLFVLPNGESGYIVTQRDYDKQMYFAPIKSSMLSVGGQISLQVKITEHEIEEEIPIFKSVVFNMVVEDSINPIEFTPDELKDIDVVIMAKLSEYDAEMKRINEEVESNFTEFETNFNQKTKVLMNSMTSKIDEADDVLSRVQNEVDEVLSQVRNEAGLYAFEISRSHWVPVSESRYQCIISRENCNLNRPYIDECIVDLKNGVREKAILDMLELINGDIAIYSNLQVNCKIILKGE